MGKIADDPEATARNIKFTFSVEAMDRGGGMDRPTARWWLTPSLRRTWSPPGHLPSSATATSYCWKGNCRGPSGWKSSIIRLPGKPRDYRHRLRHRRNGVVPGRGDPKAAGEGGYSICAGCCRRTSTRPITVPHSAVAKALLLGQRGQLPGDLVEDFRETGTSHVLAISGLHVGTLMAISLAAAAAALGRRGMVYLVVPLLLIWIYALVSGLPPSVLRRESWAPPI